MLTNNTLPHVAEESHLVLISPLSCRELSIELCYDYVYSLESHVYLISFLYQTFKTKII